MMEPVPDAMPDDVPPVEVEEPIWVPAHLHPTIAPDEFKEWLAKRSSLSPGLFRRSIKRRPSQLSRSSTDSTKHSETVVDEAEAQLHSPTMTSKNFIFDVADDVSEYNEGNTQLNAVLKRRYSLNLPKGNFQR
jgi:hypothetical protein